MIILWSVQSTFVRGNLISIDWGTWGENVTSWLYAPASVGGFPAAPL